MKKNSEKAYLSPKCEKMEFLIEQCCLVGSVTEEGGSAGSFDENPWGSNY